MKNLTFILILILLSFTGICQKPKNAISIEDRAFNKYFFNKANIPVVKGKVINLPQEFIQKISISYSIVTPSNQFQIGKSCNLKEDGTFELQLDYAFPFQQIWIKVGKLFYAGIYASKDLFIELDAETIMKGKGVKYNGPGVKYLGTDGELNTFMNNHILFKRERQLELTSMMRIIELSDDYLAKYDSLYSILQELDSEYFKLNPSDFSWLIINERQSDYFSNLCINNQCKKMNSELFNKVKSHKSYLTSNCGMNFYIALFAYIRSNAYNWNDIDYSSFITFSKLNKTDKLILDSIVSTEKNIFQNLPYDTINHLSLIKQAKQFLHDTLIVDYTLQTIRVLDSLFIPSKSDLLKMKITDKDPNDCKLMTETVLRNIQTDWCKNVIQNQHEDNLEKLAAINKTFQDSKPLISENQLGEPIAETLFGAKLYKVDNMKPETLLANLKKTFENKALILDFWATWCAPCLQDMPYSKKLHDETTDLPIEYVYLCTSSSSSIEKWKSKIAELQIGGTHIFVESGIESELMNLFFHSSFPSYSFIDAKGVYQPGVISRMYYMNKEKLMELIKK